MYKDVRKKHHYFLLALIVLLAAGGLWFVNRRDNYQQQAMDAIKKSINERALQCFVVEGAYPESLEYLEENYGLQLNHDDYYIHYEIFAENLAPDVRVSRRRR